MHLDKKGSARYSGSGLFNTVPGGLYGLAPNFKEGVGSLLARVVLLVVILTTGQLPIRAAKSAPPPSNLGRVEFTELPNFQQNFLGNPEPKTVTIELVESEYQKQSRLIEEEKQRQLAQARAKRAPVRQMVNGFYAGQCTAYVAAHFPVTWRGNAAAWPAAARAQGYVVNKTPAAGAALVTTENSWGSKGAGHVALIDAVVDGTIYISEQNFEGWGLVSKRTLPIGSPLIRAVIHRK